MSIFTNLRADRLIAEIKAADAGDRHGQALEKLAKLGPSAIPRIIDALPNASKQETQGFIAVLTRLLDTRTFPAGSRRPRQREPAGRRRRGHRPGQFA